MSPAKIFGLFISLAVLTGCVDSTKEETVTLSDLTPDAKRDYTEDTTAQISAEAKPESALLIRLGDTISDQIAWKKWDTTLFADRFGPTVSEKWIALTGADSIVIQHYTFRDSLKTKNAFYNLLDCFGRMCTSYKVGGNLRIPRRTAKYFVGEKDMYLVESSRSLPAERLLPILSPAKKIHWLYVVDIPLRGKTTWKTIRDEKETLIPESNENS